MLLIREQTQTLLIDLVNIHAFLRHSFIYQVKTTK